MNNINISEEVRTVLWYLIEEIQSLEKKFGLTSRSSLDVLRSMQYLESVKTHLEKSVSIVGYLIKDVQRFAANTEVKND